MAEASYSDKPLRSDGSETSEPPKKTASFLRAALEFAIALLIALIMTWLVKTYALEPFEVPTGSMESTIMIGDKLFADKLTILFNPVERGDVIVFADKTMPGRILVKRVIAVGGQVVDLQNGVVFVDGKPLFEPYTGSNRSLPLDRHFDNMLIEYPYTVPEGHYWVMGDNRENSADSRYFGTISEETVYGRVWMVFWPLESIGPL